MKYDDRYTITILHFIISLLKRSGLGSPNAHIIIDEETPISVDQCLSCFQECQETSAYDTNSTYSVTV